MAMAMPAGIDPDMTESEVEALTACTEENELLNSNAIKMSDAPFGRSDSEDDIIEDYDDVVNFKGPCCKGRTALERGLLVLIVLLVIIIIGLAVGLTRPKLIPEKEYCKTTQCVQASSSIMAAMDPKAEPCTDFFQYACGGWVRQNPIPKGYHKWDRIQELSAQNLYVLKGLINSSTPLACEAENKAREFYQSCMSALSSSRRDTLQQFKAMVEDVGGWSISMATNASQWYFVTALQKIHRYGAWPLFRVTVDVDERDPTRRYILKMDLGETVLPTDMYPPLNPPAPAPTPSPTPTKNSNGSVSGESTATTIPTITSSTATTTTTTTENPSQAASRVKLLFVEETVHILQALGFNSTAARQRATLMADLEHKIASATESKVHAHDRFSLYNVLTVEELEKNYTMFSWTQYFNTLGFKVTPADEVVLFHPGYLARLTTLINATTHSPADSSVLRDYMVVTLVRSLKQYFDLSLFDMEKTEADWMEEPWKRCTYYTNKALGFATGAIYVRGTGQEGNIDNIQKLISYVRQAFKEFILHKFWIDSKTRLKAEQKVDSIINKISYPSYIMNTSFLDNYYKQFAVTKKSWFDNSVNWRKFELQRQNNELHSLPDREKSWIRPPVTVNAFYSPIRNDVIFPIAMFHLPYYIPGGPTAVNFGAMGSVIGHEITHAFDLQDGVLAHWRSIRAAPHQSSLSQEGDLKSMPQTPRMIPMRRRGPEVRASRQYDEEGRLKDWWDPRSTVSFGITTQCMVDQYNNIHVQGHKVDGDFTLDENIADNGGLRAAHYAYMKWIEENQAEAPLPGLNLTNYQAFFLSYAQMYCSKWTDMGLKLHLLTDPHSPGAARVNGVLANSKTFSWAFDCPVYSKMNAQTKCEVW